MITAGIDRGSKNVKVVILQDGKVIGKAIEPAGLEQEKAAALKKAGIFKDLQGYSHWRRP